MGGMTGWDPDTGAAQDPSTGIIAGRRGVTRAASLRPAGFRFFEK